MTFDSLVLKLFFLKFPSKFRLKKALDPWIQISGLSLSVYPSSKPTPVPGWLPWTWGPGPHLWTQVSGWSLDRGSRPKHQPAPVYTEDKLVPMDPGTRLGSRPICSWAPEEGLPPFPYWSQSVTTRKGDYFFKYTDINAR